MRFPCRPDGRKLFIRDNKTGLLGILYLMRCEDWTFREAEVRLGEHRELRQTLELSSTSDFKSLYRFLQRLDEQIIDRADGELA